MNTTSHNPSEIAVSVIVPVYNSGASLLKCLTSLAAQTCTGIEFICVNDGSTDSSPAELDTWAARDKRFRVIHQPNGGYGKAMNQGLLAAKGQYIGIVEPDDWIEPAMYERLLNLAKSTGADIAKGDYVIEKARSRHKTKKFNHLKEGKCFSPLQLPEYLEASPSIWTAIYQKKLLTENNIRFSETPGASFQDLGFGIRTWLAAKSIAITHNAFYHYWEDNPVSSSRRMEDGAWAAYREIELLADDFARVPTSEAAVRSLLVKRIFSTLRADHRLRIRETVNDFLLKYSHFLNQHFPLATLNQNSFTKSEWHDLLLIYHTPLLFPRKSRTSTNLIQRLCSCRSEAGRRILRLLGMYIVLPNKKTTATQFRETKQNTVQERVKPAPADGKVCVVQLSDGLGNQLFQYAFAMALSRRLTSPVMLDVSWFPEYGGVLRKATPRHYGLGVYPLSLPFLQPGKVQEMIYGHGLAGWLRKRFHLRRNYARERDCNLAMEKLSELPVPLVLRGFYQRAEYAESIRPELLQELALAESTLDEANCRMLAAIRAAGAGAVMVHLRRGDYLNPKVAAVHGTCSADYYRRAEAYIFEKLGIPLHLFIFSDDPEWVRENYHTEHEKTVVDINSGDEAHLDINLMRHCAHAITANSTFSWWGAWLISNPERLIVAPSVWYADGRKTENLLPENWHTM